MLRRILWGLSVALMASQAASAEWKPKSAPLMTRWARQVSPDAALPEYPRPQLTRPRWQNLNGLWEYALLPKSDGEADYAARPETFTGQILVPFPIESALSGVMERVGSQKRLWYRRTFERPADWKDQRLLLHFGAVDWEATVWVNGTNVGAHRGGYDPFSFDITAALKPGGQQEVVVSVWDPTTDGPQPVGKQHNKPEGIWYTPTTGIWQTVWIEPVPETYVRGVRITPDVDTSSVTLEFDVAGKDQKTVVDVEISGKVEGRRTTPLRGRQKAGEPLKLAFDSPRSVRLWSPDDPFLYDISVTLRPEGAGDKAPPLDAVRSYFGMRKIALGPDAEGVTRILLNGKPLFQYGLLDQGFWPDGLYTAPTDEALKYDIEITKQMGFNLARKHVKVEPARWYYWCDKLGLLVWQDMPSGEKHVAPGKGEIERSPASAEIYRRELKALIDNLYSAPSIVMWVPFNEGWGQFDTIEVAGWIAKYDRTRLVNCASGWNDYPAGDVHDIHVYPGPASPLPESKRAAVLGEFGGLGLPMRGHTWQNEKNWGYRSFTNVDDLSEAYFNLLNNLRPLLGSPGLSAAIYTQTTDVEIEVNGLLTYDREIIKIPLERLKQAHRRLFLPPPSVEVVVATAREAGQSWKFTTEMPADDWFEGDYDDSAWKTGPSGFGQKGTPGSVVRTEWKSPDIWLRRSFKLGNKVPPGLQLHMHHDEDVEVYLNGVLAAKAAGYATDYQIFEIREAALAALRPGGENVIAIHCRQTGGGQYIDAGIVSVVEKAR